AGDGVGAALLQRSTEDVAQLHAPILPPGAARPLPTRRAAPAGAGPPSTTHTLTGSPSVVRRETAAATGGAGPPTTMRAQPAAGGPDTEGSRTMVVDSRMTLSGNLTRDPQRRIGSRTGEPFAVLAMAVNSRRFDREAKQWVVTGTTYFDLLCWGRTG